VRILEIATEVPPFRGGISRLVGTLAEGLKREGHNVTLLSPKRRFGEFKLSSIPIRRYTHFDVVHVWGPTPFLSDLLFLTNKCVNLVYTHVAEICWKSEFISRAYGKMNDRLAKNASAIITLSDDYRALLKSRGLKDVEVIRPPLRFDEVDRPFDSLRESKNSRFTVLYVGQLRPFKAVDILIKAAAAMKDTSFIIEGRGYLRSQLELMAQSLACSNVKFMNVRRDDDLIRLYETAHVICLPSRNTTEAYGLVLLEGAMFGCVPIACNLLGVRENVRQLRGVTVPPNDPEALTDALQLLIEKRGRWLPMAKDSYNAAHEYASRYPPSYYARKHLEIYTRVAKS